MKERIFIAKKDLKDLIDLFCGICQSGIPDDNCLFDRCSMYKYRNVVLEWE